MDGFERETGISTRNNDSLTRTLVGVEEGKLLAEAVSTQSIRAGAVQLRAEISDLNPALNTCCRSQKKIAQTCKKELSAFVGPLGYKFQ